MKNYKWHEIDLAKKLWDLGWAVIRAPASGAKAKNYLYPDIVAIKKSHPLKVLAIEVKTIQEPRNIYISERQMQILNEWKIRAGAAPFIAVKVRFQGEWKFFKAKTVITKEEIENGGILLSYFA